MPKLTKRYIDTLEPFETEKVYWDDELHGFGLRIRPSGNRTFIVQFRNAQGRSRKVTLSAYGRLTPKEARDIARQILAGVAQGEDMAEKKAAQRSTPTIAELSARYLKEHAEIKKKPSSLRNDRQMIRDYVLPGLGRLKVNAVSRQDVAKLHYKLQDKPITANRLRSLLSKMFSLAEQWGLRPEGSSPCRHIQKFKEKKRERYLSGEEMARLGEALTEAEKTEMPSAVLAIRLLMFTGARVSEILTLKWTEVDFERGVFNLPDSKTGAKLIPLSGPAIDALLNAPRLEGNPYICFGGRSGTHLVGIQKIWERVRAAAGLADVRLHDLRHSFASVAAAANMGLPLIGALLGHTQAQTTQRYAHLALDPLKAAAEEVARRIGEAMKHRPKSGKVIELKR